MKILIADDSRVMRQVIAHMLREAGFRGHQILEAKDGAQALQVAQADEPDLIISDWNMPEMTGIEFLQKLREADNQTPFGFVTTEVSSAMRDLATASGARFLIGKPFTSDDFHDALCDVID
ncbi:MAG: response regulator [Oxalobacteraceae bacterium]|nr:MAG: response regulator [Oxalobacteraceae bacterium]